MFISENQWPIEWSAGGPPAHPLFHYEFIGRTLDLDMPRLTSRNLRAFVSSWFLSFDFRPETFMRNVRTCSHIKTNGTKCGSPALRHQTLCYFHYHWDRRERRRVRLGGPVGTNKNTGIDFPILEGPESIMIALMEVQHAVLDARIDRLTAHTLLYSLQLAMQLKISTFTGLSSRLQSVTTCPELESELDISRARGVLPSQEVCSTCPDLDSCNSPEACPDMPSSRPEHAAVACGVEGPAFPPMTPGLPLNSLSPCHPERSAQREVEGPFVSSPEATDLATPSTHDTSSNVIPKLHASATPDRKQKALRLRATPPRSAQGDTSCAVPRTSHLVPCTSIF